MPSSVARQMATTKVSHSYKVSKSRCRPSHYSAMNMARRIEQLFLFGNFLVGQRVPKRAKAAPHSRREFRPRRHIFLLRTAECIEPIMQALYFHLLFFTTSPNSAYLSGREKTTLTKTPPQRSAHLFSESSSALLPSAAAAVVAAYIAIKESSRAPTLDASSVSADFERRFRLSKRRRFFRRRIIAATK